MSPDRGELPEQLLRQARAGDHGALGRLLALYHNYLGLLARVQLHRRLQGKVETADLVQEAYLEAYRDFGQFRGATEAELIGWLRQILVRNLANTVRHFLGTQGRDVRLERELAAELDRSSAALDRALLAAGSSPSGQAARREQAVLLADALARLSDSHRTVLVLRHLEELSFPEVARSMGRSIDGVKKLWARALAQLRLLLGGPHDRDPRP
jgi:RNA polymerase sigma-70 factor (ECF subfamily)